MMMFTVLAALTLAQAMPEEPAPPEPQEFVRPQSIEALPGGLDQIPVFNSNSPELVEGEGILLSTFPPNGMTDPSAHLDFSFSGRFDIFAHHVFRAPSEDDLSSLYIGVMLYNPSGEPVTVDILQAASYLSQPDAPFFDLEPWVENPEGTIYAGPGSRVMSDILRGQRQEMFPAQIEIPAGDSRMVLNVPIPVAELDPPLNGRSTLMRLRSSDTVYVASLALDARTDDEGNEVAPTLEEWQTLLMEGTLATPRDRAPTPPDQTTGQIIYGRVAGVAQGSSWEGRITNTPDSTYLTLPTDGILSYGLSTLRGGQFGTDQVQAAPMLVRYPDTAYEAQGNYGIQYSLALPLLNDSGDRLQVSIAVETPIKENELAEDGLRFFEPLPSQTFFRGTVRVRYTDDLGLPRTRYVHLVQRRGQPGEPLVTFEMPANSNRFVEVDFLYPPDATPPQVLTIQTQS